MEKLKRIARTNLAELLDLFAWGSEALSRRDCRLILMGFRHLEVEAKAAQMLNRLERRQWIHREGKGDKARFSITPEGAKQRAVLEPSTHWETPWDGRWRLFIYDLPERRRTERVLLWRALHAHRLGLVQRSVWVWPHPVEAILQGILQTANLPECFCGFVAERLFLSTDAELVATSWAWERIHQGHQEYAVAAPRFLKSLQAGRALDQVARVAAAEWQMFQQSFAFDPLLPRALWPANYEGPAAADRHAKFRAELAQRVQELAQP